MWADDELLGGVKMCDKDCGGNIMDEDAGDGETVRVVLAAVTAALVVGAAKLAAELRVPTRWSGSGGRLFSTVGIVKDVDVRGPS